MATALSVCPAIPSAAERPAVDRQSVCRTIDSSGRDPLAGIWRMGGDGATFAALPSTNQATLDLVILDSPDMSVIPGTPLGRATATGKPGTYDAELYGGKRQSKSKMRYIITIDEDGNLSFSPYKRGRKVALWRWIPYLFRMTVSSYDTRPGNVDGAMRLYPEGIPSSPVIL